MKIKTCIIVTSWILSSLFVFSCIEEDLFEEHHFDETVERVVVDMESANLIVYPSDDSQTHVEVNLSYRSFWPEVHVFVRDNKLKVEVDCHWDCDGRVIVWVPQLSALSADLGSGNIRVVDIEGNIHAETGSGNITLEGTDGSLDLETGSGRIRGKDLGGQNCIADAGSGNINLSYKLSPEDVDVETGSGNITVRVPDESYDVQLRSGSGNKTISGLHDDSSSSKRISARAGSGNILVEGF